MRIFFVAVCLAASVAVAAEEVRLIPLLRHGTMGDGVASAGTVAIDLDGNGVRDLISCSNGAPFAVTARDGAYVSIFHGPSLGCTAVTAGDVNGDGGVDVITVSTTKLRIHDPRSLSNPVRTLTVPGSANALAVAFGNVDDDASSELVVVTSSATHIYDGGTLELLWTATGYGGHSVRIGDVDGDARREVIVNGSTAYVLDAVAKVQKWGYVGGFSQSWAVGNLDADAKDEIVFHSGSGYQVSILNGDTFAISSWTAPEYFSGLGIGDADGSGTNEVIAGPYSYYGSVRGLAPADGSELWEIGAYNLGGGAFIGVAELDGDANPEIFWGAGYDVNQLVVGSADKITPEWQSGNFDGPYRTAISDIDGDGTLEQIVGMWGSGYSSGGRIEIFDLQTGASEGLLPTTGYNSNVGAVAVGQLDADAPLEIAALVGYYDVRLITWDGVTKQQEFASATSTYRAGDDLLRIANIDGDAVDEVFVATTNQVVVLNGASNIIQQALPFGNTVYDFSLADLNANGVLDLAVLTSTAASVYDTATWTSLGSVAMSNADDIEATSAGGGMIAVSASYYSDTLSLFKGLPLSQPAFECAIGVIDMVFAEVGDETRLIVADENTNLHLYDTTATTCPETEPVPVAHGISDLSLVDMNGDGRNELVLDGQSASTLALLGRSSELRGDVDGDEVISASDIDATADYLFGNTEAMRPAGDANSDERISVEDIFYLINFEYAGGAAPLP